MLEVPALSERVDDIALLALTGSQEPYAALKLSELNRSERRRQDPAELSESLRQYLYAVNAKTGEKAWQFFTAGGNEGTASDKRDTWGNDSWKTGGGGGWMAGAYDPDTNAVWWGTGNPAPLSTTGCYPDADALTLTGAGFSS